MRTPEEIKKGLKYCSEKAKRKTNCSECIYFNDPRGWCSTAITKDALDYIQQLEARMEAFTDEALAYIQQLEQRLVEANKTSMHWISVVERLPEDAERVYVALRGGAGGVYIAQYFKNKCQPQEDFWMLENDWEVPASPTHWMPMPLPPEE